MSENKLAVLEPLPPAEASRVAELARGIDLDDPSLSITYGAKTMVDISTFADALLARVRAKDAGPVGVTLTDLMVKLKEVNLSEIGAKKNFLERLPGVGALFNTMERRLAKFKTLSGQVEEVSAKLDEAMVGLLKDIEVLEQLYEHNKNFHRELSIHLAAGKERLELARAVDLPKLKEDAEKGDDSMAAQNVRDFAEKLNRFERRLHDLQLSRAITLQSAPQIRLIQSNDQNLAEKIQTSILSTIPIWKSQMVLALSLHGQNEAAKLQRQVSDTTNDLLRQNAAMLESATVETAREVERSVVDIETLRDVQGKLVATIEETLRIAQEGHNQRMSVEKELAVMEENLKKRLTTLAAQKSGQNISMASGPAPEQKAEAELTAGSGTDGDQQKP